MTDNAAVVDTTRLIVMRQAQPDGSTVPSQGLVILASQHITEEAGSLSSKLILTSPDPKGVKTGQLLAKYLGVVPQAADWLSADTDPDVCLAELGRVLATLDDDGTLIVVAHLVRVRQLGGVENPEVGSTHAVYVAR
jgi:hypothetical protein